MAILFWFGMCIAVGYFANKKGKSGFGWFFFSLILSPLLGGLVVALSKDRNQAAEIKKVSRKVENVKQEVNYNQKFNDYRVNNIEKKLDQISEFTLKQNLLQAGQIKLESKSKMCHSCNGLITGHEKFCPHCGIETIKPETCRKCNSELNENSNFCPSCGTKISKKKICSNCGLENDKENSFCGDCGIQLS